MIVGWYSIVYQSAEKSVASNLPTRVKDSTVLSFFFFLNTKNCCIDFMYYLLMLCNYFFFWKYHNQRLWLIIKMNPNTDLRKKGTILVYQLFSFGNLLNGCKVFSFYTPLYQIQWQNDYYFFFFSESSRRGTNRNHVCPSNAPLAVFTKDLRSRQPVLRPCRSKQKKKTV